MHYDSLRVAKIVQETFDARSFVLDIPLRIAQNYRYRAGQFLTFRIPHPGGAINRCYSLSSAPETDQLHKVTVKRVPGGKGSNWFHDWVTEGDFIDTLPPSGRFVLSESDAPLLLFGGGSGITPIMSLIKSALKTHERRRVRLYYANRDQQSVIFDSELEALRQTYRTRFEISLHLDAAMGLTSANEILAALRGFGDADVYICGPDRFMALVSGTLLDAGIPQQRMRVEQFTMPSGEPATVESTTAECIVPNELLIHLEGAVHKVPYREGLTILDAARKAGIDPPSSCEEGFCGSCIAKCLAGRVVLASNAVLSADEIGRGWILTCQGRCFGSVVEVTYDC